MADRIDGTFIGKIPKLVKLIDFNMILEFFITQKPLHHFANVAILCQEAVDTADQLI